MNSSNNNDIRILLVEDDPHVRNPLQNMLGFQGFSVEAASDGQTGLRRIGEIAFDIVISDILLDSVSGLDILEEAHKIDPEVIVILMTGHATVETAIGAIRKGAYDYLMKPFQMQNLLLAIHRGLEKRRLSIENKRLISDLIRKNQALTEMLETLKKTQTRLVQSERKAAVIETVIAVKHEINNPLTGILNKLQILMDKCARKDYNHIAMDLKTIEETAIRISETIHKLDSIDKPVSTEYMGGISMLDIGASSRREQKQGEP